MMAHPFCVYAENEAARYNSAREELKKSNLDPITKTFLIDLCTDQIRYLWKKSEQYRKMEKQ